MKRFIAKTLTFFIILFILDKAFYFAMNFIAENQYDKRLELLITNKIKAETIVLGSSRAARDVLAEELEKELSTTAYNLGYPGSNLEFHVYLLEKILKHSPSTKRIILVVDDFHEFMDSNLDFRMDTLYPLVKYSEINEDVVYKSKKSLLVSKLLYSYRIRENFPKELFSNISIIKEECVKCFIQNRGSMPISAKSESWDDLEYAHDSKIYSSEMESELLRQEFYKLLELCKEANMKVLFVFPPNYKNINSSFVKYFMGIVQNTYPVYIYDQLERKYKDKNYYYDVSHLNKNGAKLFTKDLVEFINKSGF